jgi:aspartate kinase
MSNHQGARVHHNTNVAKIVFKDLPDRPGLAAELFGALARKGITAEMVAADVVTEGRADLAFVLGKENLPRLGALLDDLKTELGARDVARNESVATLSVRASGTATPALTPGKMFAALAREGINIDMISSTLWGVTCLIDLAKLDKALRALEDAAEHD